MTRTGRAARLSQHISEPFVEVHPKDAAKLAIEDADIATLKSSKGQMQARVVVTSRQRPGSLFVPIHFTDRFASAGRVDTLVPSVVDPFSGQPASKSAPVSITKYEAVWYGFAVISQDVFEALTLPSTASYWTKARIEGGVRLELAGTELPKDWHSFIKSLLNEDASIEILDMISPISGQARLACMKEGVLIALLYIGAEPVTVSRDWACAQLLSKPSGMERHRLLAGRPGADMPDKGAIICACMNVGVNDIKGAIGKGCHSVDAIGEATTAGTNCGSCQAEIRNILKELSLAAT